MNTYMWFRMNVCFVFSYSSFEWISFFISHFNGARTIARKLARQKEYLWYKNIIKSIMNLNVFAGHPINCGQCHILQTYFGLHQIKRFARFIPNGNVISYVITNEHLLWHTFCELFYRREYINCASNISYFSQKQSQLQ